MSEENTQNEEQDATLNDVKNLENTHNTANVKHRYTTTDNAGILYKKIIRSLNNYSKGQILLRDDMINLVREEFETL